MHGCQGAELGLQHGLGKVGGQVREVQHRLLGVKAGQGSQDNCAVDDSHGAAVVGQVNAAGGLGGGAPDGLLSRADLRDERCSAGQGPC